MPTLGRRRALGQHFLRDRTVADRIASEAVTEAVRTGCRALLEIGPGRGAITLPLIAALRGAPSIQRFVLAERDERLGAFWREEQAKGTFQGLARVDFAPGDFVQTAESEWLGETPLAVASNLPYSAGTAILTRLAAHWERIPVMVLMFQAEVAQRLRAEPGTKSWGSLSVWIQNRWDVRKLLDVPPGAFQPPPEVNSEVVVLTRRATPRVEVGQDEASQQAWDKLLRVAFAHRRKMLRSGLPPSGPWRMALERAAVDGTKRAEVLDWDEWRRLYEAVRAIGLDS